MIGGLSAAVGGMHRYAQAFDRAAQQVVRSGLVNNDSNFEDGTDIPPVNDLSAGADDSALEGMLNMLIAQRMFLASLRVMEAGEEMTESALELLRRTP